MLVTLLFLVVIAIALRPTLHDLTHTLTNLGDPAIYGWNLSWSSHTLASHPTQVFQANIFWPHPDSLAYTDSLLLLVPPYALVRALGGSWALSLNVVTIEVLLFTLGATYALLRRLTGRTDAAILGAIAFGFSSYSFGHIGHIHLLLVGQYSLGFLLTFRILDRPRIRDAVFLGLLNVSMFLGSLYYALTWVICLATILVIWFVVKRARLSAPMWRAIVVTGLVSLLAIPVIIPYARLSTKRPLVAEWSSKATDAITVAPGSYLYPGLDAAADDRPARREHSFFPGFSTGVFALAGVGFLIAGLRRRGRGAPNPAADAVRRQRREIGLMLAAAAASLVVAIGPEAFGQAMPFTWLHQHVPGFGGIRVTARFAVPALLACCALAAIGYSALTARLKPRAALAVVTLMIALLMVEQAAPLTHVDVPENRSALAVYHALDHRPAGAVAELPMESPAARDGGLAWSYVEAVRMLYSTLDWHPRVNGQSGGWPDDYIPNVDAINQYPAPAGADAVARLHVRYLILHTHTTAGFPQLSGARVRSILDHLPPGATAHRYGTAWLVDLGPGPVRNAQQ